MIRNLIDITTKFWFILLMFFIVGCTQNADTNFFFVELNVDVSGAVKTNSTPIQQSISPAKLQRIIMKHIRKLRKKTVEGVSPIFFVQYKEENTSREFTHLKFDIISEEEHSLMMFVEGYWIRAVSGNWSNQRKWLQERFYTLNNCKTFINGE